MKKRFGMTVVSMVLSFCLLAGIAAAQEADASTTDAITVQVTNVDGDTVTAVQGELTSAQMSGDMQQAPPPDGGETPPDLPEGGGEGQPPEAPDGNAPGGMPPGGGMEFVAGEETITFTVTDATQITVEFLQGTQEGSLEDIVTGAVLEVTLTPANEAETILVKNLTAGGGFGGSGTVTQGTAATNIKEDGNYSDEAFYSSGADENALRITGATVTLDNITVEKTAGDSSNTEDGDFYGQNAALLATDGATVTTEGATVTSQAVNGNGVFSYGEGTTVIIADSTIQTTERNSGGLQTTGGAQMNASNLTVTTQGASAAAIRSDRGGGTVSVDGGSYETSGTGSPAVYSTADITVSNAVLSATASEAIVVEGKNSVVLNNCTTTGNMQGTYGTDSEQHIHNIMIYQSMSGDAAIGHATFQASGGSITSQNGDMFYITNTSCDISLAGVELVLANDILLSVEGNDASRGWGTAGANGGTVNFAAETQTMQGLIHVDEISSLKLELANASTFTGAINADGQEGEVSVSLDETSQWILTGDSYITSFEGDAGSVERNGFSLYVNGETIL